jgi:hypothetical protein
LFVIVGFSHLHYSCDPIEERERAVVHVAHMGEKRNACRFMVGKPEGKWPLGRNKHR